MRRAVSVLAIGGSSSDGAAGIQVDVRVISSLGLHPACAVTAITAQNSRGVQAIWPVPAKVVVEQMGSAFADLDIRAVKVGMLWSAEIAREVAKALRRHGAPNVVFDPVMAAQSDSSAMAEPGAARAFLKVAALCELVTPNLEEAGVLSGVKVRDRGTACRAVWKLIEAGARAVLLKSYPLGKGKLADILFEGGRFAMFKKAKLGTSTHGGGCLLSSAVAARLAAGDGLPDAVSAAEECIERAIAHGIRIGAGIRAVNPSVL